VPCIDIHQHLWPEGLIEALGRRRSPPRLRSGLLELAEGTYRVDLAKHDAETRLTELDRHGIDVAVLSLQTTLGLERLSVDEREELTSLWELGALEVVAASGGRFAALASGRVLPGCVGAVVPGNALRDIEALAPLFAELTASGGFLFVHPSGGAPPPGAPEWWPAIVDYSTEMQGAYFTWLSYAQQRWSSVNVVFAILAGGGPFQLERLASRGVDVRSALHPNVFFETASHGRRAIELCIETFGVHQIVYGSDVPVVDAAPTLRAVRGFGQSVVQLLTADNPSRLLP
jgi:6-methylsalicylate decarboxylase